MGDADKKETVTHLKGLLAQLTSDADFDKRVAKIEDNYYNSREIDDMIWNRIKVHQANQDKIKAAVESEKQKNDLDNINWTAIIQTVIAALIIGLITYMINRG